MELLEWQGVKDTIGAKIKIFMLNFFFTVK